MTERLHWPIVIREMEVSAAQPCPHTCRVSGRFFPFPPPQLGLVWAHCLPGWRIMDQGRCAVKSRLSRLGLPTPCVPKGGQAPAQLPGGTSGHSGRPVDKSFFVYLLQATPGSL